MASSSAVPVGILAGQLAATKHQVCTPCGFSTTLPKVSSSRKSALIAPPCPPQDQHVSS